MRRLATLDAACQVFGASEHRYQLAPPLSPDALESLETRLGVKLPPEVCAFLTEVASAGAGPHYGLEALDVTPNTDAAVPFTGGVDLGDEVVHHGSVLLAAQGCGLYSVLVTAGRRRGEVVTVSGESVGADPEAPDFLTWYERWLNHATWEWATKTLPTLTPAHIQASDAMPEALAGVIALASSRKQTDEVLRTVGFAHLFLGDPEQAAAHFERAAEAPTAPFSDLSPGERNALLHLDHARLAAVLGNWQDVADRAQAGLEGASWASTKSTLNVLWYQALKELGDEDGALARLDVVAERSGFDLGPHYELAWARAGRDIEGAADALERAATQYANMWVTTPDNARRYFREMPWDERLDVVFGPVIDRLRADERTQEAEALAARAAAILEAKSSQ